MKRCLAAAQRRNAIPNVEISVASQRRYVKLSLLARIFQPFRDRITLNKYFMKEFLAVLSIAVLIWHCNNETKDSVEKADSANKKNIDSPSTKSKAVTTDEESASFLVKAADGGMTEMQLGKMAEDKAADTRVKGYGAMMIHDHSLANDEVKALAAQRNVLLPDSVSDSNKKIINDLSKQTGKSFDKAYTDAMIKDHEEDIDEFEKAAKKVNDTDVRNFINNTLPKLKNHLDSARAIRKSLK